MGLGPKSEHTLSSSQPQYGGHLAAYVLESFSRGTSEILNAWMPAIDSFEGGFWITGAVAYSDYFSIVAQSVDDSGQLLADPVLISPAERASYYPSIAAI